MLHFDRVSFKYDDHIVLENIKTIFKKNKITGIIGPNGSGKTTMLYLIQTVLKPSNGTIHIDDETTFENQYILDEIQYMNSPYGELTGRLASVLKKYKHDRKFDYAYALDKLNNLGFKLSDHVSHYSRGETSILFAIIGLAIKTKITLFDEIELGMDDKLREYFYELLLLEQQLNPRTIIISTNIFSETKSVFDEIKIIHNNSIILDDDYESVMSDYVIVTYKDKDLKPFLESLKEKEVSYGLKALVRKDKLLDKKNIMVEKPTFEYIFEILTERGKYDEKNQL